MIRAAAHGPRIVTAEFEPATQARLQALRDLHYPAERNRVPAHLTLFHHLPPSIDAELVGRLKRATAARPPMAELAAVQPLEKGVAYRVSSPALAAIREELADAFAGLLSPDDLRLWSPHVTIQNKVKPREARALQAELAKDFHPAACKVAALRLWAYRDGPWEALGRFPFRL